jgi:hypothetical protein
LFPFWNGRPPATRPFAHALQHTITRFTYQSAQNFNSSTFMYRHLQGIVLHVTSPNTTATLSEPRTNLCYTKVWELLSRHKNWSLVSTYFVFLMVTIFKAPSFWRSLLHLIPYSKSLLYSLWFYYNNGYKSAFPWQPSSQHVLLCLLYPFVMSVEAQNFRASECQHLPTEI